MIIVMKNKNIINFEKYDVADVKNTQIYQKIENCPTF